jgi:uncharacterized membrane protein
MTVTDVIILIIVVLFVGLLIYLRFVRYKSSCDYCGSKRSCQPLNSAKSLLEEYKKQNPK